MPNPAKHKAGWAEIDGRQWRRSGPETYKRMYQGKRPRMADATTPHPDPARRASGWRVAWLFLALALVVAAVVALAACQPVGPTMTTATIAESGRFVILSSQNMGGNQTLMVMCDTATKQEYIIARVFDSSGIAPLGTTCKP